MNILIISQITISVLFLKYYRFLPILEIKNGKKIYSAGYFFALTLINYLVFSPLPLQDKVILVLFPLSAFLLGTIDDHKNISPWIRLLFLTIITLILINQNSIFNLNFISFNSVIYKIDFPLDLIFTCLCFLLLTNAMNFADGINCLSGTIFVFFYSYILFRIGINLDLILIILIAILFFIILNSRNICFMGDGGIYLLSFLIGQLIILSFKQNYQSFQADEILLLLYLPGFDLFRLFLDRTFKRKNPFSKDENHLHHLLKNKLGILKTIIIYMLGLMSPIILYHFFLINNFVCILISITIYLSMLSYAKN